MIPKTVTARVASILTEDPTLTAGQIVRKYVENYHELPKLSTVKRKATKWRKEYRARLAIDEAASSLRSYYDDSKPTFPERSFLYLCAACVIATVAYLIGR